MNKYKLITISQTFTLKGLEKKATDKLNRHAEQGWEVTKMRKGWSGFFFSTLYILLEKKSSD